MYPITGTKNLCGFTAPFEIMETKMKAAINNHFVCFFMPLCKLFIYCWTAHLPALNCARRE